MNIVATVFGFLFVSANLAQADIAVSVLVDGAQWPQREFATFQSDPVGEEDETTVQMKFIELGVRHRWEGTFTHFQTGSIQLKDSYDLSVGAKVEMDFFVFPFGTPGYPQCAIVNGAIDALTIDNDAETARIEFTVTESVATASNPEPAGTGSAGVAFGYSGVTPGHPDYRDWGQFILETNANLGDVYLPTHPTVESPQLGISARIDGLDGFEVRLRARLNLHYLETLDIEDSTTLRGYLDGMVPSSGFSYTYEDAEPDEHFNTNGDTHFVASIITNVSWSAHDLQFGILPVAGVEDGDGDGISDAYEAANGLDAGQDDALLDLDGDGASNMDEFVAGTAANDATSVFKIVDVDSAPNATELRWSSVAARSYQVQMPPDGQVWVPVSGAAIVGEEGTTSFTHEAAQMLKRFYRVVVNP